MQTTTIQCHCRSVQVQISGTPMLQYYCHCDDCQAVHGKAYAVSLFPAAAVAVTRGETEAFTLKTSARTKCTSCGTYIFALVAEFAGVNGELLPDGVFKPAFHMQCRYAAAPINDALPHYKGIPARFRGSDELMQW